ncbi:tyrosine-type recombinase/integrase [Rhodopseudomonas sp. B29]|uniref:tyrosine-type recombinase/integrase n=1 Tax=Rhodopseudomonas sp. B29 TaxID=95607 RepID=UPI00034A62D9|nr:tyrosine-type recombinase/integrase [Rhodopseudomonas sp. B29]
MPLTLYRRGKIWHYRGTVAKRRLRGSTGAEEKDIAERFVARLTEQAWKSDFDGPQSVLTFAQAAITYRTAGKPTRFLEPIENYWKDTLVKDITAGAIRKSALVLYPSAAGATRNRNVIVPTQAIINHSAELELCSKISVKRFDVDTKIKKPATAEWVRDFMEAASHLPHLAALACFMFCTGARISEAIRLEWGDVDLQKRTALIRSTKIGAERVAHLPQPLVVAMANIKRDRPQVFRYVLKCAADKSWRSVVRQAGLEPLSTHCCRHGFATALLRAGVDVVTVAKLGGWKTPQHVFETYGHALDDITLTDRVFDTPQAQSISAIQETMLGQVVRLK